MHTAEVAISVAVALALLSTAPPSIAAEENVKNNASMVMWTGGMGLSYPLLVSISAGAVVPLGMKKESQTYGFPGTFALHGNLDVGLHGGMVSAGLAFPISTDDKSMISIKAAALRTWLFDIGPNRDQTYHGGLVELLVESHPSGKIGLGYFSNNNSAQQAGGHFVYVYVGIGL